MPVDELELGKRARAAKPGLTMATEEIALSRFPKALLKKLGEAARENKQCFGHAELFEGVPILVFLAGSAELFEAVPGFFPWAWDGYFGKCLTVTSFRKETGQTRVLLSADDEVTQALSAGPFVAMFSSGADVFAAYSVNLLTDRAASHFREQLASLRAAEVHFPSWRAHRAEMLEQAQRSWTDHVFTRAERNQVEWVQWFRAVAKDHVARMGTLRDMLGENDAAELPLLVREAITAFQSGGLSSLVAAVGRAVDTDVMAWIDAVNHCTQPQWLILTDSLSSALVLYMQSPEATDVGSRLPWLDGVTGVLEHMQLDLAGIESACTLHDFWARQLFVPRLNWGRVLGAADVPVVPTIFQDRSNEFPRADDVEAVEASFTALLAEATRLKRWVIPPHACVQLSIGPFCELEFTEFETDVCVVLRTANREYYVVELEPAKGYCEFRPPWPVDAPDGETADAIAAAIKMLLAAVIRDFWIVEERESVFAERQSTIAPRGKDQGAGPRVVYLPRVKYLGSPNVERCSKELEHASQREHVVSGHLRKARRASVGQLEIASLYGFAVPTGYTFVRPHERGKVPRDIIYRSKSALQALYEVDDDLPRTPVRWFRFEQDVRDVLAKMGFAVEHVAASRRGDRGVDVYARKGRDLEEVCWVIQCKCWSLTRKVGPDVVRDLVGALARYPAGTRGMIVTTTQFTTGAIGDAERAGIRLMNGTEFIDLKNSALA